MSAGQGIGTIVGAVIGTIFAPGAGTLIGAGIGGAIGGFVDPPKAKQERAQFEADQLQFNTFSNTLPVPVLFGVQKWNPNCIFIGDSYSRVEVVGSQTVQQGKSSENQDVEALVYYADFALALCEGPIRGVIRVEREDIDISDQEGTYWTQSLGSPDEDLPTIVTQNPNPVERPIPWEHTAKLLFSGRLGQINRIPRISVVAMGPDLRYQRSGSPGTFPSSVRFDSFYHDDLTDRVTMVTGDRTVVTLTREGEQAETATLPAVSEWVIDVAVYDGRTDTLFCITKVYGANNDERVILVGERDFEAADDWEIASPAHPVFRRGIESWTVDESTSTIWFIFQDPEYGWVLHGIKIDAPSQQETHFLGTGTASDQDIKALWYDKPYQRFYLLYEDDGVDQLRIRRFSLADQNDDEEMVVGYGHVNPIAIFRTGDMIGIFDKGKAQPLHLFEWGRNQDRFALGSLDTTLDFNPRFISSYYADWDADAINFVNDGSPTGEMPDRANGFDFQQGTASEQPTYRRSVAEFNGYPAVEFDGSATDFDTVINGIGLNRATGYTVFLVFKPLGVATQTGRILSWENTAKPPSSYVSYNGIGYGYANVTFPSPPTGLVSGYVWWETQGSTALGAPVAVGEAAIFSVRLKPGAVKAWKNGVSVGEWISSAVPSATVDDEWTMGRFAGGGAGVGSATANAAAQHANCQVARVLVYDRDLQDSEMDQVHDYLRQRYRISYVPAYSEYLTAGDRMIFGNPQRVHYAAGLAQIMVLDQQTAASWSAYHFNWNGDNWSRFTADGFVHVLFEEDASCAGAVHTVLTSPIYGAGIPSRFVDLYSTERTSGFCIEPVDMRYYTSDAQVWEARYQLNYLVASRKNLSSILQEMNTAFNGYLIYNEGKLEIHCERDTGDIDGHYDGDNIIEGSFGFQEVAREDRWNEVTVECIDGRDNFRQKPVKATAEWERDIFGEVRRTTITATGITRLRQAGNIAWGALLGFTTRRFVCQFSTAAEGLRQKVGDTITVTRPELRWDRKPFKITRVTEAENEEISFQCIEHVPLITEIAGFPLQQSQNNDLIYGAKVGESNYDPVAAPVRVATIENTQTGEIWLFASRPDRGGPYGSMRWHAIWEASQSPGATFYPGNMPLSPTSYTMVLATSVLTTSALLKSTITGSATSIPLTAVLGVPPEQAFDIVVYNEAITSGQFNNPQGNGYYERIEGSSYDDATEIVTAQLRGIATNAVAHTVQTVAIEGIFTRRVAEYGALGLIQSPSQIAQDTHPLPLYLQNQSVSSTFSAAQILDSGQDEVYIGFSATDFEGNTPNGVNNIRFTVSSNLNITKPEQDLAPVWEYSDGAGTWKPLTVECDETDGFRRSGTVSFKSPSTWAKTNKWNTSSSGSTPYFPAYNGVQTSNTTTNPLRYYIRIRRPVVSVASYTPTPHPRTIKVEGQTSNAAYGYHSPTVFFMIPGAVNVYDFISAEQGHVLTFKAQPVGVHNQSIILDELDGDTHAIQNLASE